MQRETHDIPLDPIEEEILLILIAHWDKQAGTA
jgi:hypothetical protein